MFTDKRWAMVAASAMMLVWTTSVMGQAARPGAANTAPDASATSPAATDAATVVVDKQLTDLWNDFLYYIRIARTDLARSYGEAIVKTGKAKEVYILSQTTAQGQVTEVGKPSGAIATLQRGMRDEQLKPVIEQVLRMIEQGYQAGRSDPQRIDEAITRLGGDLRQSQMGKRDLAASGEYALPQLVQKLQDPRTSQDLKQRIIDVLPTMGRDAVAGMCQALKCNDPVVQESLARALGRMGYHHAVPHLKALADRADTLGVVKEAALDAIRKIAGAEAAGRSIALLAYGEAQRYYDHDESLMSDPRHELANIWYWQDGTGLTYKAVPRAIHSDIEAMRLARIALENDPSMYSAMSLWLAANFRRAAALPQGVVDPTQPADMPSPAFFALASPPEILQDVLRRGLKERNLSVILGAMTALVQSQGAKNMVEPVADGVQPLVEALNYPDRRVRYLAAVSLAAAEPKKPFNGSDIVLRVLTEALRQSGKKTVAIVIADKDLLNTVKDQVRGAGYEPLEKADMAAVLAALKDNAPVVDAVVCDASTAVTLAPALRASATLANTPLVIVAPTADSQKLAQNDARTVVLAAGAKIADALSAGQKAGETDLTDEQKIAWAIRAAETARLVAMTGSGVYNLEKIDSPLIDALGQPDTKLRLAAAEALTWRPGAAAQRAIADLALAGELDEGVRIQVLDLLTSAVRRSGNQLSDDQVKALYGMVAGKGAQPLREAAARAWGALNLPAEKSRTLILEFSAKN